MKHMTLLVNIRLHDGKMQRFTLEGDIENPDIKINEIAYNIERAINETVMYNLRAHITIEDKE